MQEYRVSYNIRGMYHSYIITAKDEEEAKAKALRTAPHPELIANLTAERYFQEWN